MEPIAVNRVTITKELFAESHAAVFSYKRRKMLLWCGIVFLAFGVILLAVQTRFPVASMLCVPALLTGAFVIVWALTLQRSECKRRYKAFRQRHGEASSRTITCGCASLLVDTSKGEPIEIEYADINEHRESEHLHILICRDHTGVQLAKNGFEIGSWEVLSAAIEEAKRMADEMESAGI